jgi:hypothetical protein
MHSPALSKSLYAPRVRGPGETALFEDAWEANLSSILKYSLRVAASTSSKLK